MNEFEYVRANSVAEAAKALSANSDAMLIAGGHTLIPTLKQRLNRPAVLVDISGLAELKGIRRDGGNLVIGAGTLHREIADSAEIKSAIPALSAMADGVGDPQVRNRGTIGGSVANNDPAADYPAAVLASARPSSPTSARSQPTISSPACSRPRSSPARSSPPSASRSRPRPAM